MSVYTDMGLKRVVNASGRVTVLGVSTYSDEVAAASIEGGQSYVVIEDLIKRAGELIAAHTGAEDACPTSSASAAIALTVAALVSKGNRVDMMRLPDSSGLANQIVIQKGHAVDFGAPITTMIRLGGGVAVEAGQANEVYPEDIEGAINENICALMYVKSHHCVQKGMVEPEVMRDIAHAHGLPFIMDCAAEEDLKKYIALGADAVCYSGAKALEATTSGFVCGRRDIMENVRKQYSGIGRAMKVGKEQIVGLLCALDAYEKKDHEAQAKAGEACVDRLVERIAAIRGLKAEKIGDEAGRAIYRCRVSLDKANLAAGAPESAAALDELLKGGDPVIWARTEFLSQGYIDFDPRPLKDGDEELIVETLTQLMHA